MEITGKELNEVSKFLSYILRHKPDSIGLQLDPYGWLLIDDIIANSQAEIVLSKEIIKEAVSGNKKQRFTISDDGKYIRANQGHSIKVDLQLTPQVPPDILYHGTASRFLESILKEGLKAGQRHHVHLSSNIQTAKEVGSRYGKPVILTIDSKKMHQDGYQFFISNNLVWLTESVPTQYFLQTQDK